MSTPAVIKAPQVFNKAAPHVRNGGRETLASRHRAAGRNPEDNSPSFSPRRFASKARREREREGGGETGATNGVLGHSVARALRLPRPSPPADARDEPKLTFFFPRESPPLSLRLLL